MILKLLDKYRIQRVEGLTPLKIRKGLGIFLYGHFDNAVYGRVERNGAGDLVIVMYLYDRAAGRA